MTADRKPTLGEFLKSEREKRGLTIEQTASATKVGLKILRQLEADQYVDLPALPFVRGFVRNYGKFLGLDGDKLLADYAGFLEEHARDRPKRDAGHSGYAFERPEGEQSRKILWGVMAGMLIFGGAVVFLFKPSLKRKHHGHVDKLKPGGGVEEGEEGSVNPNPSASATPSPSGVPSGGPSLVPAALVSGVPNATPVSSSVPAGLPIPAHTPSPTPSPVPSPEAPFIPPKVPLVLAPSPLPAPSPAHTPSPTPSPKPVVVAPSPVAVVAPVPSPVAAPVTAPVATPSGVPVAETDDLKADPLQSGRNLAPKEVHQKIILRTKADVWVRYRCDDKKLMKFALKKDKILVLRAKAGAYVQVSNPDSVTIQPSGKGETLFSQFADAFDYHGNPSAAFGAQARDKMEENFKVGTALPFTDSPAPTP